MYEWIRLEFNTKLIFLICETSSQLVKAIISTDYERKWWPIVSYRTTLCEVVTAEEKAQTSQQTETATVNKLLDSYTSGDIYRCIHPLRTFAAFDKWRKNSSNAKQLIMLR